MEKNTSSADQKAMLMGGPCKSFYSSLMVFEFKDRWLRVHIPYEKFIVVSSWGELLIVERPFQATDFLLVRGKFHNLVLS